MVALAVENNATYAGGGQDVPLQTSLNAEWAHWVFLNLSRGCVPQAVAEEMALRGFDPAFAWFTINWTLAEARPVPFGFDWHTAANTYVHEPSRLPAGHLLPTSDWPVKVSLRLARPHVAILDNILSHQECDEIIRRSISNLRRSGTVDPQTGGELIIDDRTSEGTSFVVNADPFIARLDRRISEALNWPVDHGEGLQVLHYLEGGEYKPHFDQFAYNDPGSHHHLAQGGQRISTLVMYLNDVEAGGSTVFPEIGLEVMPRKGAAVYFEYTNSLNQTDPLTLHGGAPVGRGEKWIMTKWMHQRSLALTSMI
ncbi:2OG-Fe(II) oxygenase [Dyella sp.]|uniref:2OG-Fe(II) oxygenase n=1 Tax=Dyella sp. TaxID=1869338 RepID=UPI002ED079E1